MTDREAILATVLATPDDDIARLVFADWLEEHDEAELGRFIRAGVTAARYRDENVIDDRAFYQALVDLATVCETGATASWLSALGMGPTPLATGDWAWDNAADRVTVRVGGSVGIFERGMLARVSLTFDECPAVGSAGIAAWPVDRFVVFDVRGLVLWLEPPSDDPLGWKLTATLTTLAHQPGRGRLWWVSGALSTPRMASSLTHDPPHRWAVARTFPDRTTLSAEFPEAVVELLAGLRISAGDVWPSQ